MSIRDAIRDKFALFLTAFTCRDAFTAKNLFKSLRSLVEEARIGQEDCNARFYEAKLNKNYKAAEEVFDKISDFTINITDEDNPFNMGIIKDVYFDMLGNFTFVGFAGMGCDNYNSVFKDSEWGMVCSNDTEDERVVRHNKDKLIICEYSDGTITTRYCPSKRQFDLALERFLSEQELDDCA